MVGMSANPIPTPKSANPAAPSGPTTISPVKKGKGKKPKSAPAQPKKYQASIFPIGTALPDSFVKAVREVEAAINGPVWLLIQDSPGLAGRVAYHGMDDAVLKAFFANKFALPTKPVNVILDSPGGDAKAAFRLANLLRSHCGGFNVYVYEWAKSAATLFALGASNIFLSKYAELGPLDVQIFDPEREDICSALDEVQALERLNAFALQAVDSGVLLLKSRSGKSVGSLLPHVLHFVSEMLEPLFEKLDTVHYTQMSRLLKIGEAYAIRLLEPQYGKQRAEEIARVLVNEYPEHGFYIDSNEARRIGLRTTTPPAALENALEKLKSVTSSMNNPVIIGQIKEVP